MKWLVEWSCQDHTLTEAFGYVMSGGMVLGGVAGNTYDNNMIGGMKLGGSAPIGYENSYEMDGGGKGGGTSQVEFNGEFIAAGGMVLGGEAFDQIEYSYEMSGGMVLGGDSIDEITINTTGGMTLGGSADVEFIYNHAMIGGMVLGDGLFSNGKKYRLKWTIPSDYVIADISNFLLTLAVDLPDNRTTSHEDLRIEDTEGNVIKHETIEIDSNRVVVAVRRDLSAETDTEGFVYYGS
ncbi:MAG: hypothetical protein U0929_16555 [Planctomycetaceae bacterium]